ncbi:uncharacterized protein LOC110189571 [Drosophila serrata]|uniref:uncharacterized protein LOC110189571 n=1 Tax=Drosophila serrata TaxID=7274 RepID=UPI000A1D1BC7|nr:uncharacterized protein LOC110189571 [Drosophila serrata]
MTDLRSATNWSSILDSREALRKYLYPRQPVMAPRASEHEAWPLNSDWKLARDTTQHTEATAKKSTISLPKRVERMIWAKPSMVVLTKAAVRTERAKASAIKFHEKLQAKKTHPEKSEQPEKSTLPEKPQRPPLWQPKKVPLQVRKKPQAEDHQRRRRIQKPTKKATKAMEIKMTKPSKSEVSGQKTPFPVHRKRKPNPIRRWYNGRPSSILVVDAKTDSGISRPKSGGAEHPMDTNGGQAPRRSKKSYGVPLCNRPTKILGMGYPYSRHMQLRQQQLCQQPEYRDQYVRMLHHQQRQLERYYGQPSGVPMVPDRIKKQIQHKGQHQNKYAVPAKTSLKGLKKGKRLCGNFYYD